MIEGVHNGYSKALEIVGVGSRAQVKGTTLVVSAGYSHPVEMPAPAGITFKVENNTRVIVSGIDKELVGNEAAKVRAIRPPEPYKGKGINTRASTSCERQASPARNNDLPDLPPLQTPCPNFLANNRRRSAIGASVVTSPAHPTVHG